MNSFSWSLEKIRSNLRNLQKEKNILEDSDITGQIDVFQLFIETIKDMPMEATRFFFQPYSYEDYKELNKNQYSKILRTLKSDFDVKWVPNKHILKGKDQKNRNTTWWSDTIKPGKDFYWRQFKEHYLNEKFNPNIVNTIDIDSDSIVNQLGNPTDENFERYGMVVGHVQAGKTGNYSSVICKAADAGYKFIVVISGTNNNLLRNQTQERINESFIGQNDDGLCGVGLGHKRENKDIPFRMTSDLLDFNKMTGNSLVGANFDTMSVPIVLVIKKNATNLNTLIKWLTDQYKDLISQHSMLMIDDESDYASINTKTEENPAKINSQIRQLIALFGKSCYVAYTATPSANIFIDYEAETPTLGKDLFPKDFIFPLETPDNYIGATKIFNNPEGNHLVTISDNEDIIPTKHKSDFIVNQLPKSLKDAIRLFIINVAIRNLRNHADKHNSMLVHVSLNTGVHKAVFSFIEIYVGEIKKTIKAYGLLNNFEAQSDRFIDLRNTFYDHYDNKLEFNWEEVLFEINNCIETIIYRQVHQERKIPLVYKDSEPVNVIVVGGLSLARGFTLEGLSISYFIRSTMINDTLMQMARWFGYRDGYVDLCRVYMTLDLQDSYKHIEFATDQLFETFQQMVDAGKTPEDYGLYVIEDPENVLQITAKNKRRHTYSKFLHINLTGKLYETIKIYKKEDSKLLENLDLMTKFVNKLIDQQLKNIDNQKKNGNFILWRDVNKSYVEEFLGTFRVAENSNILKYSNGNRMPMDFLQPFVKQHNDKWDICLYGGEGKNLEFNSGFKIKLQQRKIVSKPSDIDEKYREIGTRRQISSGSSEAINLPLEVQKLIKDDRIGARAYKGRNHLLMLHIIENKAYPEELIIAFGISISGDGISGGKNTKILMNKVMAKIEDIQAEEVESEL